MNILDNNIKIDTIITSGGTSSRFGSNKLLEKIPNSNTSKDKETSVILTTIEKFIDYSRKIIIPCHNDVKEHIKTCINKDFYGKIEFVNPGETRQKSVFNGLLKCAENPPDMVLIHDGARPFIDKKIIKETIEKLKTYKGVCVGIYSVDTVKITDENGQIIKTVDRKNVFCAQTPQGFDFKTIFEAHKKLQNENFTDDCCLLEALNIPVFALVGSPLNKKITFREDLA